MKRIPLLVISFFCLSCLLAQSAKIPVSARLATNTYSWSYESGSYVELPAIRYYDQFFDSQGRVVKSIEYSDAVNVYRTVVYDFSQYRLPAQTWTDFKGSFSGKAEIRNENGFLTEYLYDKDNNLLFATSLVSSSDETARMVRKRADGTIEWVVDIVYDEYGDIIRKTMRNPDGNAVAFLSYHYVRDEYGNWTSRKEYMSVYGVWQWPKEIVHRELKY